MTREKFKELGLDNWHDWAERMATPATEPESKAKPAAKPTPAPKPAAAATPASQPKPVSKPAPKPAAPKRAKSSISKIDIIETEVKECTKCELSKGRTNTVFARGDCVSNAVMFIGEGPGEEEDLQGLPFVGRGGKLLDAMIAALPKLRNKDIYITNMVKCRPPGNRDPKPEELQACRPYLDQQIALIQPEIIATIGKIAANGLLDNNAAMRDLRNAVHEYRGCKLVCLYHPAYLLRSPQQKRQAWLDLLFLGKHLS